MKRTPLRRTSLTPQQYNEKLFNKAQNILKKSGKWKFSKSLKRTRLRMRGVNDTSVIKDEIQYTLRELVIKRDKKCILYGLRCRHEYGMEGIVWQAEHLIERNNTDTFADSRLVVLVCKNCHGWKHFKKSNHDQYDKWVKSKLPKERVELWEKCEDSIFKSRGLGPKTDLRMQLVVLKQELANY